MEESFKDAKEVIKSRKSKDTQYTDKTEKGQKQRMIYTARAMRTPPNTEGEMYVLRKDKQFLPD